MVYILLLYSCVDFELWCHRRQTRSIVTLEQPTLMQFYVYPSPLSLHVILCYLRRLILLSCSTCSTSCSQLSMLHIWLLHPCVGTRQLWYDRLHVWVKTVPIYLPASIYLPVCLCVWISNKTSHWRRRFLLWLWCYRVVYNHHHHHRHHHLHPSSSSSSSSFSFSSSFSIITIFIIHHPHPHVFSLRGHDWSGRCCKTDVCVSIHMNIEIYDMILYDMSKIDVIR